MLPRYVELTPGVGVSIIIVFKGRLPQSRTIVPYALLILVRLLLLLLLHLLQSRTVVPYALVIIVRLLLLFLLQSFLVFFNSCREVEPVLIINGRARTPWHAVDVHTGSNACLLPLSSEKVSGGAMR